MDSVPVAALAPLIICTLAFDIYCWIDIARSNQTNHLPKWAWAIIVGLSFPLGGILYLLLGRSQNAS